MNSTYLECFILNKMMVKVKYRVARFGTNFEAGGHRSFLLVAAFYEKSGNLYTRSEFCIFLNSDMYILIFQNPHIVGFEENFLGRF